MYRDGLSSKQAKLLSPGKIQNEKSDPDSKRNIRSQKYKIMLITVKRQNRNCKNWKSDIAKCSELVTVLKHVRVHIYDRNGNKPLLLEIFRRMPSSWNLHRVALLRTDVSEERITSIMFRVRQELGLYIPEDGILHGHSRENLKSYIELTGWTL
jgi:hypothetical protein